jgi:hypothetical protein
MIEIRMNLQFLVFIGCFLNSGCISCTPLNFYATICNLMNCYFLKTDSRFLCYLFLIPNFKLLSFYRVVPDILKLKVAVLVFENLYTLDLMHHKTCGQSFNTNLGPYGRLMPESNINSSCSHLLMECQKSLTKIRLL